MKFTKIHIILWGIIALSTSAITNSANFIHTSIDKVGQSSSTAENQAGSKQTQYPFDQWQSAIQNATDENLLLQLKSIRPEEILIGVHGKFDGENINFSIIASEKNSKYFASEKKLILRYHTDSDSIGGSLVVLNKDMQKIVNTQITEYVSNGDPVSIGFLSVGETSLCIWAYRPSQE